MRIDERLPKETGKDYALRIIKQNIVDLELEPGTMISANELAAELGISKTPVREAFTELSHLGIVEIYPQYGNRIALVDRDMVEESQFMRASLECAVVRQLCNNPNPAVLLKLQDNIKIQQFFLDNHKHSEFQKMDNEFHEILFRGANRMHIYKLMRDFSIHFDRIRRMRLIAEKDTKVIQDHINIYNAISEGDANEAVKFMKLHLYRYQVDEEELKTKYKNYFK